MSDSQFPGAPPDAFPGSAGGTGGNGDDGGGTPTPTPTGGSYPVYICIDVQSLETPLVFKAGDVGARLVQMLRYINGTPIDLTGKTIHVRAWPLPGGDLVIDAEATVLLAEFGIVAYTFLGGDTDTPGAYNLEFVIVNTDGTPGALTYPSGDYLRLRILPNH